MLQSIQEFGAAPTAERIVELEQRLGVALPVGYRTFLLAHNGGVPRPAFYPIEGMENNPVGDVQLFFGLDTGEEYNDVFWYLDTTQDSLPAGFLPVAISNTGNLICVVLDGDQRGEVHYWETYAESEPAPWKRTGYSNAHFVAPNFESFLAGLHEYDPLAEYPDPELE